MYFDQVSNSDTNQVYNLGLWNACSGTTQSIETCGHPTQSYNWGNTPNVGTMLPQQYQPGGNHHSMFTALFALCMAGVCLSFLLWILSLPIMLCCAHRRLSSSLMSTLTWLNFLTTIGAIVIGLVLAISLNRSLTGGWRGVAGNSIWTLLGAMGALLIGSLLFSGSCCLPKPKRRVGDPEMTKPHFGSKPMSYGHPQQQPGMMNQQPMGNTAAPTGPSTGVRPLHIPH
ncbi:hypothetical protein O0I10_005575 [Lichtheimia ornata]|uniref:Uncharacterized protein n=1 Tax=Lichtheimia ornata TaxID=688661 RepID=A0AAD7V6A0_9FUNG|nr:uncharacterized protein O0I10_005575 [Lichtheimia ornata]KAJ8658847.1 hypothetical protein O0I10_005575 [Lichtheimia ornata]